MTEAPSDAVVYARNPAFMEYEDDSPTWRPPMTEREERDLRRKKRKEQDTKVLYRCTFRGTCRVQTGDKQEMHAYEETVFMDHSLINGTPPHNQNYPNAVHVFVKYYAFDIFSKRWPGYMHKPATHNLIEVKRLDGLPINDLRLMSREEMEDYIDDNELSVNSDLYGEETELRTAIRECEADSAGFVKQQERRKALTGKEATTRRQVATVQDRVKSLMARAAELEAAAQTIAATPVPEVSIDSIETLKAMSTQTPPNPTPPVAPTLPGTQLKRGGPTRPKHEPIDALPDDV